MNKFKISKYLVGLLFIFSCQEEKDNNPPIISISSPTENASYQVLDNVAIRANITDDEIIKSVQVSLINDETRKKVLSSLFFSPNQGNFELQASYSLDDSLLESGRYYFKIEALDNDNTGAAFQYIQIIGIPKKKLGVVAICSSANATTVYTDKNDLNFLPLTYFAAPYFKSVLNSYDQQLWFLPKDKSDFLAYHLNKNTLQFNQSVNSGFNQAYTDIKLRGRDVVISTREGEALGYSFNYVKNYNYQTISDRIISSLGLSEKYILVDEADLNGSNRFVNVLFGNTGVVQSGIAINYACEAIYFLEEKKAILFQNDEIGGRISELILEASARRTVKTFPDSILRVEQVSQDEYLISTAIKVLRYNYSTDNLLDYLLIPNAKTKFESLNNELYVASGNQLEHYNYALKTLIASTVLPQQITALELRYNK